MRSFPGAIALVAACCGLGSSPAIAADGELSLYQAMEIVTGTDMRERPRGFALCLEDVLVRLSGDPRLRADPRVAEMKAHAADYVVTFNYVDPIAGTRPKDDQGTYDRSENLTVTFDPTKIDALLASLGEQPWHGKRPVLVPVISVHPRKGPVYLLSTDAARAAEQRGAFQRVANEAGIAVRFPAASENAVTNAKPCSPDRMLVVRGTLDWSETAPGWIGHWDACWNGAEHIWAVRGGGYDRAFENIVEGALLLASGRGEPERMPIR